MKARNENGSIVKYKKLPSTYTKSDGSVILGFRNAPTSVIEAEGFFDVEIDAYDPRVEELSDLAWDATNNVFKRTKSDKTIDGTLAELKEAKKAEVKQLANKELSKTDWYVTRQAEDSTKTIPSNIATDRAAIRTKVTEREAEIDALTTKKDVVKYNAILFDIDVDDLISWV